MERVRQEDKEEVAIFLKKYNKINSKFMKTKFIINNLKFKTHLSVEEKDFQVEIIYRWCFKKYAEKKQVEF